MVAVASLSFLLSQIQVARKKYIFIAVLLFIFLAASVIITDSRGAFGIVFLLMYTMILLSKVSVKTKTLGLVLLSTFLVVIVFIMPAPIIEKQIAMQQNNDILSQRDKVWRTAFEIGRLSPILGVGGGNSNRIKMDQIKASVESRGETFNIESFSPVYSHPHNIYLANLVDRGIFGLIIFLNFMAIWLITLIKYYKKFNQDPKGMLFTMGSFSAWATIFGVGFVNTTFHHENALLALFFLGLHLNYLRQKNQLKLF
jgi:O-antigen ligase